MQKVVLITGGTGALGKIVTKRFLDSKAKVIVTYRVEAELQDLRQSLDQEIDAQPTDVTNESSLNELAAHIKEQYGRLDSLVCLVGGFAMGSLDDPAATFEKMMQLNTKSFLLTLAAMKPLLGQSATIDQPAHVVAVSARPGIEPAKGKGMAIYTASKAAVAALVQTLGAELLGENILVNAVAPSTIDTPANRTSMPKADPNKWVKPEQLAEAVFFLSDSPVISGSIVPVYGQA